MHTQYTHISSTRVYILLTECIEPNSIVHSIYSSMCITAKAPIQETALTSYQQTLRY